MDDDGDYEDQSNGNEEENDNGDEELVADDESAINNGPHESSDDEAPQQRHQQRHQRRRVDSDRRRRVDSDEESGTPDELSRSIDSRLGRLVPTAPGRPDQEEELVEELEIPRFVWDPPNNVVKLEDGKAGWQCGHCKVVFKGNANATKAKAHLAQVTKEQIAPCVPKKDYPITPQLKSLYQRQWQEYKDSQTKCKRKSQSQAATVNRSIKAGVRALVQTGTSRPANRMRQEAARKEASTKGGIQTFLNQDIDHPSVDKKDLEMDWLISKFVHEEGRPFNIVESENLQLIIKQARVVSLNYKPPHRKRISGEMLQRLYDSQYNENITELLVEAEVFGIALYGDGATIAKTPYLNFLASGGYVHNVCLEIHDCSAQMATGGKKSASYIAECLITHMKSLDPNKTFTDLVIFDGASNVQKAGEIVAEEYPLVSVTHGGEHVVSLWFSDIAKTLIGGLYVRTYQLIYKWFGGRHHSCYATFMATSERINGKRLGLIRPAGTRMAGYWIAWTRAYRLRRTFQSTLAEPAFQDLEKALKPPKELIDLIENKEFWTHTDIFLKSMFCPLLLLRNCDRKSPCMDKQVYCVIMTERSLQYYKTVMNKWDDLLDDESSFLRQMQGLKKGKARAAQKVNDDSSIDDDPEEETDEEGDEDADVEVDAKDVKLGSYMLVRWNKRKPRLSHDYANAAWLLSPCIEVQRQVKKFNTKDYKASVNRLLKKLFVPRNLSEEDAHLTYATVNHEFWSEWQDFTNRRGEFPQDDVMWLDPKIKDNQSHMWHYNHTLTETKWLGQLACRVCSKISGIGSAERNWGDVKQLKSGKRTSLKSEQLNWQATIYGSACAKKARDSLKVDKNIFNVWNDTDMESLGFDNFGVELNAEARAAALRARPETDFLCYLETWEPGCIMKETLQHKRRLLTKYGGLVFTDGDDRFTISSSDITFQISPKKEGGKRYCLHCLWDSYDPDDGDFDNDYDLMDIDNDLHGVLWTCYKETDATDSSALRYVTLADKIHPDTEEWQAWQKDAPNQKAPAHRVAKAVSARKNPEARRTPKKPVRRGRRPKGRR
jgi:hypothetical protein